MKAKEVLSKLKSLGTAQTRKTYSRHGVSGPAYGVRYGDLYKLVKQIKVDHELALALWDSGNHDARVLATMVADPEQLKAKDLRAWVKAVDNHVLSTAVADIAGRSPAGQKMLPTWLNAKAEWPAATGWMALSGVARKSESLTSKECRAHLKDIEKRIHNSPNRVKYSMNTAMIAMGSYVPGLEAEAVKVANRIGQVEVDHGLTDCKTPLAAPYIRKAAAAHRAKQSKAAKKKTDKKKVAKKRGKQ